MIIANMWPFWMISQFQHEHGMNMDFEHSNNFHSKVFSRATLEAIDDFEAPVVSWTTSPCFQAAWSCPSTGRSILGLLGDYRPGGAWPEWDVLLLQDTCQWTYAPTGGWAYEPLVAIRSHHQHPGTLSLSRDHVPLVLSDAHLHHMMTQLISFRTDVILNDWLRPGAIFFTWTCRTSCIAWHHPTRNLDSFKRRLSHSAMTGAARDLLGRTAEHVAARDPSAAFALGLVGTSSWTVESWCRSMRPPPSSAAWSWLAWRLILYKSQWSRVPFSSSASTTPWFFQDL